MKPMAWLSSLALVAACNPAVIMQENNEINKRQYIHIRHFCDAEKSPPLHWNDPSRTARDFQIVPKKWRCTDKQGNPVTLIFDDAGNLTGTFPF